MTITTTETIRTTTITIIHNNLVVSIEIMVRRIVTVDSSSGTNNFMKDEKLPLTKSIG